MPAKMTAPAASIKEGIDVGERRFRRVMGADGAGLVGDVVAVRLDVSEVRNNRGESFAERDEYVGSTVAMEPAFAAALSRMATTACYNRQRPTTNPGVRQKSRRSAADDMAGRVVAPFSLRARSS